MFTQPPRPQFPVGGVFLARLPLAHYCAKRHVTRAAHGLPAPLFLRPIPLQACPPPPDCLRTPRYKIGTLVIPCKLDCLTKLSPSSSCHTWTRVLLAMKLLVLSLCLALAWAQTETDADADSRPGSGPDPPIYNRCEGIEMDAVAVNEEGLPYFFKDDHVLKGLYIHPEESRWTFAELGRVDAAFCMHNEDNQADHDHMFFFSDTKVFNYYKHKLEDGYPKDISMVFPGIPDNLDAAVECPKSDCNEDSVIFFKGDNIYYYNLKTKAVDEKDFKSMPNCTSALRFNDRYYCFHGHMFSKFDPKTGEVPSGYPKVARDYFMRCDKFRDESDHVERERCHHGSVDAITSDNAGNISTFKGLDEDINSAFIYNNNLYITWFNHVYAYRVDEPHTLLDGYPKGLTEELGLNNFDAVAVCEDQHIAHYIRGNTILDVDLRASPRVVGNTHTTDVFKRVDAAMCDATGVKLLIDSYFYHFASPMEMVAAKALPEKHKISRELFGCNH
ncbi:hypothetical protein INR49_023565 [Caranx melampygus]|nr:hypothetical protein INR49_023565 [Caranx melampygus]